MTREEALKIREDAEKRARDAYMRTTAPAAAARVVMRKRADDVFELSIAPAGGNMEAAFAQAKKTYEENMAQAMLMQAKQMEDTL
jgi:hypothetical protein